MEKNETGANWKVNSRVRLFAISVILCRSVKYVCPRHEAGTCISRISVMIWNECNRIQTVI